MGQELPRNSNERGNDRSPAEFQGSSRWRRTSGKVNSAALFARLLKQAKPMFGLLRTVKIGSASASADAQLGAGEFTPRRESSPLAVRRMGVTPGNWMGCAGLARVRRNRQGAKSAVRRGASLNSRVESSLLLTSSRQDELRRFLCSSALTDGVLFRSLQA